MNRILIIAAFLILIVFPVFAQKPAPTFSLSTGKGETLDLETLKGKVVVVNFWATWCPPCKMEIPGFLKVYEKYRKKGVEIIGVSLREKWSVVSPFLEKYKITYPVVIDNGKVADAYGGIGAIPTTFFVDRKGNLHGPHLGFLSEEELEKVIKELL